MGTPEVDDGDVAEGFAALLFVMGTSFLMVGLFGMTGLGIAWTVMGGGVLVQYAWRRRHAQR